MNCEKVYTYTYTFIQCFFSKATTASEGKVKYGCQQ